MAEDLDSIYRLPLHFAQQNVHTKILKAFGMKTRKKVDLSTWKKMIQRIDKPKKHTLKIGIAGKYFAKNKGDYELTDAYHALIEAIEHAGWHQNAKIELTYINTNLSARHIRKQCADVDGIIVPIGWGTRGVAGKLTAIQYARENKVPYLGLCYGMQLACVEYAQNVLGMKGAHSEEVKTNAQHNIIHRMPYNEKYQVIKGEGNSMRLGAFDCVLKKGTRVHDIYAKHKAFKNQRKNVISERHRHRFEFNNAYRSAFEKTGFVFSGVSPDDFFVEYIELPKDVHPFFVATQAHPEYKSRPHKPHPVFIEYLKACISNQ